MFTAYIMTEESQEWRLETVYDEIVSHSDERMEEEKIKDCKNEYGESK